MSARAGLGRRLGAAALLAGALLLGGCEDALDPGGLGTFDLVEANGEELPTVVFDQDTEFGHMVATAVSGSITLGGSRYTERMIVEVTVDGQPFPGGDRPVVVEGDYTIEGQILSFEPDRTDFPAFSGTLTADGTVLTTTEVDPDLGELNLVWVQ